MRIIKRINNKNNHNVRDYERNEFFVHHAVLTVLGSKSVWVDD